MKPCSNRRKEIAWLALGELEPRHEEVLRAHLRTCEGCRGHFEELSNVTEKLAAARMQSDVEASPAFHRDLMAALREEQGGWRGVALQLQRALLNWRVTVPLVSAVVAMALFLFSRPPATPPTTNATIPAAKKDIEPSIANYQMVANQSLEKLDELLTSQGNRSRPTMPIYTASIRGRSVDLE